MEIVFEKLINGNAVGNPHTTHVHTHAIRKTWTC